MPREAVMQKHKVIAPLVLFLILLTGCSWSPGEVISISTSCVSVGKEFPPTVQLSGKLALDGAQPYLLDVGTKSKEYLPIEGANDKDTVSDLKVSPDGKKLVFILYRYNQQTGEFQDEHLELFQGDGVQQEVDSWRSDFGTLIRWFGDDWLLFVPAGRDPGTIILFNPVDGVTKEVPGKFQGMYDLPPIPAWYQGTNPLPLYDASLSLAVFLQEDDAMNFILWDTKANNLLWKKRITDPGVQPQWSPSGERILFAIPDGHIFDFYGVDRMGHESRLTNLGTNYQFVYMGPFSWSPDGQKIAFWVDARNDKDTFNPSLAVFDITKGEIVNYCLGEGGRIPVWSPDGKQIAVIIQQDKSSSPVLVVFDLSTQSAVAMDEKVYPIGWVH